ncbi:ABC transporter permease, partial [Streptomyces sp. SID13726]|nr:ABC transporter permease [Streptomyces sp. SID13726]
PSLTLLDGAWPGPGEIVLEQSAAETAGLSAGDATTVVLGGESTPVTVSGVFGIEAAAAGAVLVGIDGETARDVFAPDGMVPQLAVWATPSSGAVDEDALAQRVGDVLPEGAEAVTGEQARAEAIEAVEEVLGFVESFLLVF